MTDAPKEYLGPWKFVLAVVATISAITIPLTLYELARGASRAEVIRQQRAESEHQAAEVVGAMIGYRAALTQMASLCARPNDPKCRDQFAAFVAQFYRLSWYGPPLLEHLYQRKCSGKGR